MTGGGFLGLSSQPENQEPFKVGYGGHDHIKSQDLQSSLSVWSSFSSVILELGEINIIFMIWTGSWTDDIHRERTQPSHRQGTEGFGFDNQPSPMSGRARDDSRSPARCCPGRFLLSSHSEGSGEKFLNVCLGYCRH